MPYQELPSLVSTFITRGSFKLTRHHSWWKLILEIANPGATLVTWPYHTLLLMVLNSMRDCIFQCTPAWCQCSPAWSKSVVMGLRSGFTWVALGFAFPHINFHHKWRWVSSKSHEWWKLIRGRANPSATRVKPDRNPITTDFDHAGLHWHHAGLHWKMQSRMLLSTISSNGPFNIFCKSLL